MNKRYPELIIYLLSLWLFVACGNSDDGQSTPQPIGSAQNIEIFDIDNAEDASDIRVFYTSPSSVNLISEYRLIIVPTDDGASFNLSQAEALPSTQYQAIDPVTGLTKLNLNSSLMDAQGLALSNGNSYQVFILAMATDSQNENTLSSGSNALNLSGEELQDLYVSSRNTNSVEVFDGVTAEHITSVVPSGGQGLNATQDVLFDNDGKMLVSGRGNGAIFRFDPVTKQFLGFFTKGYTLDNPTKMSFGPDGYLYVSQWGNQQNAVARFDGTTGDFIDEIVASRAQGCDHAWDAQGNLYTVAFGASNLINHGLDGTTSLQLIGNNQLNGPVNLWIDDAKNEVVIMDWNGAATKRFDLSTGQFLGNIVTGVNGEGFAMRGVSDLFVCDWPNNRILLYNRNSATLISEFVPPTTKLLNPNAVALGPNLRPQ